MSENSQSHPLEQALAAAIKDEAARGPFYQAVLNSVVFVVGRQEDAEANPEHAGHVQLKQWQQPDGTLALPFFATPETLKKTLGEEEPFLAIPAIELFRLAGGAVLVFTTLEGTKAFAPDEVQALLSSVMALDPLAKALIRAAKEQTDEAKKTFYNVLINSPVFVIGRPEEEGGETAAQAGPRPLTPDSKFTLASCPHPFKENERVVPFFSSLDHLKRAVGDKAETYLTFPAMAFLSMARGMERQLVLNPGFDPHKIFTIDEVDFLLTSARPEPFEQRHFKPGTKVTLGPPKVYPQELVGDLLDFLPKYREVAAAYLTSMIEEGSSEPVLVVGFEAEDDLGRMFYDATDLINKHASKDQPIDFAKIAKGESGLSEYFLEKVDPFYRRSIIRDQEGNDLDSGEKKQVPEEYDKPGFFGRVKRMFGGAN